MIGPGVCIGRDCAIGAGATIAACADRRPRDHSSRRPHRPGRIRLSSVAARAIKKFRRRGRVIIQDDVEIGANTTIDRGSTRDTVIGEGTKIDNLVQIAHNVSIGRHCLIASQAGISGSVTGREISS